MIIKMKRPHILLLDEPTNHLNIESIQALGKGLREYKGGLIIITHNLKI